MKFISLQNITIAILSIVLFIISKNGIKDNTKSDPQLTLLTSQAILEKGTTNLYDYYISVKPEEFADGTWKYMVRKEEKKVSFLYPVGTSLLSVPIVGVARLMGYDFIKKEDDMLWQSIISSVCVSVIFILLFLLAMQYISYYPALIFSFLICLGTSLISSLGLALWNFNFEIIFLLLTFIHLSKTYNQPQNINGYKLGLLIFLSWLCRPSALVIFGIITFWLFIVNKKEFKKYMLLIFILFIPFYLYSSIYYRLVVPPYYHPLFWMHKVSNETFLSKLSAVLFSPARGFFVFTPIFILSFIGLFYKEARKNALYVISFFWFALHTVMLARQSNWWGGWSFGPRLFTDALIPVFIMLIITYSILKEKLKSTIFLSVFVFLAIPCIYIHTIKGAYDVNTRIWNDSPLIDENISYYKWNADYLQFFATPELNAKKKEEYEILKQLDKGLFKLNKGSNILLNCNYNVNTEELVTKINNIKPFNEFKLYYDYNDILINQIDTFYITRNLLEAYSKDTNHVVVNTTIKGLSNYIEKNKQHHIFISTKKASFNNMMSETKDYFRTLNSKIIYVEKQQGFVLHLFNGNNLKELFTPKVLPLIEYEINNHTIKVISDGSEVVTAMIDGKDYCTNEIGFNVLCVNTKGEVIDATCFTLNDEEIQSYYKVYKK